MTLKVNYLITDENITVNYNGETHIVSRKQGVADKIIQCIKDKTYDNIPELISLEKRLEKMSNGHFTIENGQVLINGRVVPEVLGKKIIKFEEEGLPYEPLVKFAQNLQLNPSFRAVQELYSFLEKNDHPLTSSGGFIAYKRVHEDFKDIHSRTFDNSPGNIVSMPRNEVNEDPNVTCSTGLHVSNWEYAAKHFHSGTGVMIEVEVNPKDVVAIPIDYSQSKMRTCEYKVLGIVENPSEKQLVDASVKPAIKIDPYEDDEEEPCYECGLDYDNCYCEYNDFDK